MAEVRLVDLDVIKRYSLVVRCDAVPAEELLAALESSRQTVVSAMEQGTVSTESAIGHRHPSRTTPTLGRAAATKRAATTRATTTKRAATTRATTTKRAATKRGATKRATTTPRATTKRVAGRTK